MERRTFIKSTATIGLISDIALNLPGAVTKTVAKPVEHNGI